MGDVVAFRASARKMRRRLESDNGAGALILFFTGVRYERQAPQMDAAPGARPGDGSGAPKGTSAGARKRRRA